MSPASGMLVAVLLAAAAVSAAPRRSGPSAAAPDADAEALARLLKDFDAAQAGIRTMTANFTEQKELALLKKPLQSSGKFYYTRPHDVLWEYLDPAPRVFLVNKEEFLAYYPAEKRAERINISRYQSRLLRIFGIGQVSEDLRKYYDLALAPAPPKPGVQELVLLPRRRVVRKRIAEVRFWVDDGSHLPVRMQYTEEDGDRTTISFADIRINDVISESVFRIQLPADIKVQQTFSGFGASEGG